MPLPRPESLSGVVPVDWWSLLHLGAGIVLGLLVGPWWLALGLIVGYEVLEAGLRRFPGSDDGLFEYESWPNILADVLIGFGGWFIGSQSPWRWIVLPW